MVSTGWDFQSASLLAGFFGGAAYLLYKFVPKHRISAYASGLLAAAFFVKAIDAAFVTEGGPRNWFGAILLLLFILALGAAVAMLGFEHVPWWVERRRKATAARLAAIKGHKTEGAARSNG